jgi:hypothetical protein
MNFKHKFLLILFYITIHVTALGQQVIQATIVDKDSGHPVPFASIGIAGTSRGTSSNLTGQFSLIVSSGELIKISCVGYESLTLSPDQISSIIELNPAITELSEVVISSKPVNARGVVRRAFANISKNYTKSDFQQRFFYRHYCMDDSVYGRLIEASVDILKHQGYRHFRHHSGEREEIRVNQLRRSLDKTISAQGHDPISIGNIIQSDLVAYQTSEQSAHPKFYEAASNLKTDFDKYVYTVDGITVHDGQEVYMIAYKSKKDSILTTTGYVPSPSASGLLYIAMGSYAIIKTDDIKQDGPNTIHTTAYYRKFGDHYYPYHFIREGTNSLTGNHQHAFHIELMSIEIKSVVEKFTGSEPDKNTLLNITYDSVFWSTATILKTTPLEDKIIKDLGGGRSLNEQFYRYRQYEWSTSSGGKDGEAKFNWFKEDSKGERILFISFLNRHCKDYLSELEQVKQLSKQYRGKIAFVLLCVEKDETAWQELLTQYSLFTDGIHNYRIDENSSLLKHYGVKEIPSYSIVAQNGDIFDLSAAHPNDPQLEKDFKFLIDQASEQ